jgi:hypothetical protein
LVWFYLSGTNKTPGPDCAKHAYYMIKDENSSAGKRQLATLLAAKTSGKEVTVHGDNTCTRWGDGEDVELIGF